MFCKIDAKKKTIEASGLIRKWVVVRRLEIILNLGGNTVKCRQVEEFIMCFGFWIDKNIEELDIKYNGNLRIKCNSYAFDLSK